MLMVSNLTKSIHIHQCQTEYRTGLVEAYQSPAKETQLTFEDFESLYTNSEGLENREPEEPIISLEQLEPVATADTDFGDLPTPSGAARPDSSVDTGFYENFPQAENGEDGSQPAHKVQTESSPADGPVAQIKDASESPSHSEDSDSAGQGLSELAVEAERDGVSVMADNAIVEDIEVEEDIVRGQSVIGDGFEVATHQGETPAIVNYNIVEEVTDYEVDAIRAGSTSSDGLEITSELGKSPAAAVEFHVEEVVTEGRRTEVCICHDLEETRYANVTIQDPELAEDGREPSLIVESIRVSPMGERPGREGVGFGVAEVEEAIEVDSTPQAEPQAVEVTQNESAEQTMGPSSTVQLPGIVVDDDVIEGSTSPYAQSVPHITLASSPPRMFEPGIPMPVSADPTVPDPASVHNTPPDSPKASGSDIENQRSSLRTVLTAVPSTLLQHLSRPTGLSGLFTPYSQVSSGQSSPALQGSVEGITAADEEEDERDELESSGSAPVPLSPQLAQEADHEHDADLDADGDIDLEYTESDHQSNPEEASTVELPQNLSEEITSATQEDFVPPVSQEFPVNGEVLDQVSVIASTDEPEILGESPAVSQELESVDAADEELG